MIALFIWTIGDAVAVGTIVLFALLAGAVEIIDRWEKWRWNRMKRKQKEKGEQK
jgi:hypothetical protein